MSMGLPHGNSTALAVRDEGHRSVARDFDWRRTASEWPNGKI
jgi:hypothetical protein